MNLLLWVRRQPAECCPQGTDLYAVIEVVGSRVISISRYYLKTKLIYAWRNHGGWKGSVKSKGYDKQEWFMKQISHVLKRGMRIVG